jgi:predicted metal-dependent hydrolase
MKNEKKDERIVRLLDGSELSVEKIKEFTPEETDAVLRSILKEKSKGISVRRAIFNLSGGDDKLMLRLQNKYRNTLKKQPHMLAEMAREMGLPEEAERVLAPQKNEKAFPDRDFLRRRLESEINALYDRLAQGLKEENERLRQENARLKEEMDGIK